MEAEQAVLGALIEAPSLIHDVTAVINSEDLYHHRHQIIFDTIMRLATSGQPVENQAVIIDLVHNGLLDRVGGAIYIGQLVDRARPASVLYYSKIIAEHAVKRRLIEFHTRGIQAAQDGNGLDVKALLEGAQTVLDALTTVATRPTGGTLIDVLESVVEDLQHGLGGATVHTGIRDLDDVLAGGLRPGQVMTIAARTSVGKTLLGLDVAINASIRQANKHQTLFWSGEMTCKEMTLRLLSNLGRVDFSHLMTGDLTADDWDAISRTTGKLAGAGLHIRDDAHMTPAGLLAEAKRIERTHGDLGLIVVDYVGLLKGDGPNADRLDERVRISRNMKALKQMAKALDIPVVVLAQANRATESAAERRPSLHNLKDSSAIEEDSDIVILMYRPELAGDDTRIGEVDLIVAKNRNGRRDVTVAAAFRGHYMRIVDMQRTAHRHDPTTSTVVDIMARASGDR
jgi:replicative DNA helicase